MGAVAMRVPHPIMGHHGSSLSGRRAFHHMVALSRDTTNFIPALRVSSLPQGARSRGDVLDWHFLRLHPETKGLLMNEHTDHTIMHLE